MNETNCSITIFNKSQVNQFHRWIALSYAVLFIISFTANLRVLFKLCHYSRRRFRDHILLLNLCAADLFVTFTYMPSEMYTYTIGKFYDDAICKLLAVLKALGIYVSSCMIIGISFDRYLSIVHPLSFYGSNTRNKIIVILSWVISIIASTPQIIIFKRFTNDILCREMCGDTLSDSPVKRIAYNLAVAIFAYLAPLLTILYSYFRILYVLHKRCDKRTFRFSNYQHHHYRDPEKKPSLVQQDINTVNIKTMTRAKLKTLKLTALIVITFIVCWTPYYLVVFYLLITDVEINETASLADIQQPSNDEGSLLIVMMLAVSNSVLDPIIYGCFMMKNVKAGCFRKRLCNETTIRRVEEKDSKQSTIRVTYKGIALENPGHKYSRPSTNDL
ncbi:unnamed protein product [Didymodactylos carnosus]|uniref:G-protein coupled receptors family 1 profile domain-containing protein n=1 Tax=Didymodactylos carnosus TaxID=1234261 RepID=A0A813Z5F0_9BILA|nr:unnamed protein product [Didymodactylos carnosus]CAF1322062.1 unnamed protein product [Didymodactylos carnosus]CAF3677378.1 unnamed protein product [Didymodactylos carnosus]CAF4132343.1 unnamed protein product [Didymodactylos carnosus]